MKLTRKWWVRMPLVILAMLVGNAAIALTVYLLDVGEWQLYPFITALIWSCAVANWGAPWSVNHNAPWRKGPKP